MNTEALSQVLTWMRTTDLQELSWRRGGDAVELRLEGAAASHAAAFPATSLVPVAAPGVGIFRWSAPGKPRTATEGKLVSAGEPLGLLETGGAPVEVAAPAAGRLAKILIDEGKPVEWGQPLFLIAP
ncbi:MAG: biotin/lipoyl-binding protein [Elusimicrobia bacterium]|nr:biotin/lipoyl-binding protein [Elusimicrobiota bacterium]